MMEALHISWISHLQAIPGQGLIFPPIANQQRQKSILMAQSCHPPHVLKNVPVGELIRLRRNSLNDVDFHRVKSETLQRLACRGYPAWTLKRASNIVSKIPRDQLMGP